jgi:hypothetical protein
MGTHSAARGNCHILLSLLFLLMSGRVSSAKVVCFSVPNDSFEYPGGLSFRDMNTSGLRV